MCCTIISTIFGNINESNNSIHSGKPVINCSGYVAGDCSVGITNLFKEVIAKSLVSDVIANLSLLLKINQNEIALKNLLPLFVSFMNASNNVPLIYTILFNLFENHTQTLATHINIIFFERFNKRIIG